MEASILPLDVRWFLDNGPKGSSVKYPWTYKALQKAIKEVGGSTKKLARAIKKTKQQKKAA